MTLRTTSVKLGERGSAAIVLAVLGCFAWGQDRLVDIPSVKADPIPTIDGRIEPNEWPEAARREGFTDADTNIPSDERAEFWITYDSQAIYFAGRVYTNPKTLVRDEYRQNVGLGGNDALIFSVSPTGLPSNYNEFGTNSNGATSISLSGGRAAKTEWLGEIEAHGRVTETGWECEMRIPWRVMTISGSGPRDLRFNVFWYRSNKQNTYVYRYYRNDNNLAPRWLGVELPELTLRREILLLPYAYAGLQEGAGPIADAGLDFKTSLTPLVNMVGTINPDFRNIESSILSLDFSYFERLASENRPFFQEGSQYLRTGYDNRLFASQRIPSFDAGLNVYGQLTPRTNFGAITTVDFGKQRTSAVSVTSRPTDRSNIELAYVENAQPGLDNQAGMLNYLTNWANQNFFFTNQFTDDEQLGSGWRNNIGWGYNDEKYYGSLEYLRISEDYFPRLGFAPERNFDGGFAVMGMQATPQSGAIRSYGVETVGASFRRLDGGFYRNFVTLSGYASFVSGFSSSASAEFSNFEGSADHLYSASIRYPAADPYRGVKVSQSIGSFLGQDYQESFIGWDYRPLNRVQLSGSSQFVDFGGREEQHILSARWDIGKYESVGGRLVARNGDVNWYLSYRLSGRRGAEYFLLVGDPRSNVFANRVVLKAVFPLSIRY